MERLVSRALGGRGDVVEHGESGGDPRKLGLDAEDIARAARSLVGR